MASYIDTSAKLLARLLEEEYLPSSLVKSETSLSLFNKLIQIGLVQKQRKGAGSQYCLSHKKGLKEFIEKEYPSGLEIIEDETLPRRVKGIKSSKNSKSFKKLEFDLITLRGESIIEYQQRQIDLSQNSSDVIFLSLKLESHSKITIQQSNCTIITVENPTAFTELKKMVSCTWDIAVYTGGKMSDILINQLKYWDEKGHKVIHFGDYDFVGIEEFIRVLQVCPKARLYLPKILKNDFVRKYGNSDLLKNQVVQHKRLLPNINLLVNTKGKEDLKKLYDLIQTNAKGLEQESLYSLGDELE